MACVGIRGDNPQMAELMIKAGASVNAKDNKGDTPLSYAEDSESFGSVSVLQAAGATR